MTANTTRGAGAAGRRHVMYQRGPGSTIHVAAAQQRSVAFDRSQPTAQPGAAADRAQSKRRQLGTASNCPCPSPPPAATASRSLWPCGTSSSMPLRRPGLPARGAAPRHPRPTAASDATPSGPRTPWACTATPRRPHPPRPPGVTPYHPPGLPGVTSRRPPRPPRVTPRRPPRPPGVPADHPYPPLQAEATFARPQRWSFPRKPRRDPPPGRLVRAAAARRDAAPIPNHDDACGGDGNRRARRNSCAKQSGHAWRQLPPR